MDLDKLKINNKNIININDSLKAPLLKLDIKLLEDNMQTSRLEVYVDSNSLVEPKRKTYIFELETPLRLVNNQSDEFIIEPIYDGAKVKMESYVIRKSNGGVLLATPVKETINNTAIILYEGANTISTNCSNVEIEVIYPKDEESVRLQSNAAISAINNENGSLSLDDIYFKDCFTETEKGINAEFNKLTINCLNSTNGNFTLDCDGNLVVNSITTKVDNNQGKALDFDAIYPVGSIYLSVNDVDPGSLFTGTWEKITGYYLYAGTGGNTSGSNSSSGPSTNTTGSTTLTANHIPSHSHSFSGSTNTTGLHSHNTCNVFSFQYAPGGYTSSCTGEPSDGRGNATSSDGEHYHTFSGTTGSWGSTSPLGHTHTLSNHTHNVEPLRIELYCYKRVA